jgi:hypothetical protein
MSWVWDSRQISLPYTWGVTLGDRRPEVREFFSKDSSLLALFLHLVPIIRIDSSAKEKKRRFLF